MPDEITPRREVVVRMTYAEIRQLIRDAAYAVAILGITLAIIGIVVEIVRAAG